MNSRPFTIAIPEARLDDLKQRLRQTRWPSSLDADDWEDGTSLAYLQRLSNHWLNHFDWRAQEARLNRLPQFQATIDGQDIHFIHRSGQGPAPMPLILTHGWPGSFIEMERIIPLLTDPAAHGGEAADAFHVVVPSLPGFGFSAPPASPGCSARHIAGLWRGLMHGLGYQRFGTQGGDIGAAVSLWLARRFPDDVVGAHVNYIPASYRPALAPDLPPPNADEQAYLDTIAAWASAEGAYAALQSTKPLTLAYAMTDSPVGLAAWIVEKFRTWSDCDGDIERAFTLDDVLTDVSLYWFGHMLDASYRIYKENRRQPLSFDPAERVATPLGVALFPRELPMPPRSWLERVFDVQRWNAMPRGGHFAALEQPALLAEEIRAFFRPLRAT
ncbi:MULTISPECIES: epoxide hydrolase [unclassified Caballeronia]|uniref:epoxide hydrolase family protein n=1 Tax=unclassified Caballeronia TaxID=2646786 RepID=UPI00285A3C7C|nr:MULTISPECIES: epoxide hydrolase [unclassified Caballeronia]MDR5815562.1 epoxide hydrolase [Caballeronia sp. LZ033]MDR5880292.1 epoxide hydrolase [Caballeronia sp. LZ032]